MNAFGHRDHIAVTCEQCQHRERLCARFGDPGHGPGDSFYVLCENCESVLLVELPGRKAPPPAFVSPWIGRLRG